MAGFGHLVGQVEPTASCGLRCRVDCVDTAGGVARAAIKRDTVASDTRYDYGSCTQTVWPDHVGGVCRTLLVVVLLIAYDRAVGGVSGVLG